MKYLLIILLLVSCGTRKTSQDRINIKSDSITIDNKRVLRQEIILNDIYIVKPFDVLKPMVINGKEYINATIVYDNSKVDKIETIDEKHIERVKKENNITNKETEKTDYTILYISIFFILALFIFLWFKLKK